MKLADVVPDAIAADAGVVRNALLSDSVICVLAAGAALDTVIVHVADPPDPRLAGTHPSDEMATGVSRLTVAVRALLPSVAVIVAV